jgi:hypothetical protein
VPRQLRRLRFCAVLGACLLSAVAAAAPSASDNNTHIDRGVYYASSAFLTGSGGVAPYTFTVTGMPSGVQLNGDGSLTGVTCGANGKFTLSVTVTDSTNASATLSTLALVVNAAPAGGCSLTFTSGSPPAATVGSSYSFTFVASGGTSPYTYTLASGTLPTGLMLSGGTLSGTPTAAGTYTFAILTQDSGTNTGSQTYTLTVSGASAPTAGNVSQTIAYNAGGASPTAVTLALGGGAATSVAVASAAAHGTATASGTSITYLPTANYVGSDSFTYTATNANGTSSPATATITVSAPTITLSPASLPNGTAGTAYSQSLSASGGLAPYAYAVTAGALPGGLTLSGGTLSGTPASSGSASFTITATDSSSGTHATGSRAYTLTIAVAAPTAGAVSYTAPYNPGSGSAQAVTLNLGGGAAASVAVASAAAHGTATASGTSITYLPTANYAGADSFTYTATNASGTSSPATVTVTVSAPTITLSPASLPNATAGSAYSQTLSASGGLAPYTYAVTSGALPAGLTLSGGTLSGTPSSSGSASFTITATDAGGGTHGTGSRAYTLAVDPAAAAVPTAGAVSYSAPYNAGSGTAQAVTLNLGGGTAASVAVASAASHGTATASGTTITYLPTANFAGSDSFTYTATNASGTSAPATVSVTISAPTITLSPTTLPNATAGSAYSQTLVASGGLAPYTYAVTAGALPGGLTLSGGTLSGTPSSSGSASFTITATDSGGGTHGAGAQAFTLVVDPAAVGAPTAGAVSFSAAYNGGSGSAQTVTLSLAGGTATGVAVASAAAHGTATASGTTITYLAHPNYAGPDSFTYTATNASGTSAPATVTVTVAAPVLTLSPSTLPGATVGTAYAQSFTATGGRAPYTYAVTAGSLPAGLTLVGATLSGTPTTAGTSNFTLQVTDTGVGTAGTASVALQIVVGTGVAPPTAGAVTGTAAYNPGGGTATAIALNLGGGTAAAIAITTNPAHGTATVAGTSVAYLPVAGYYGADAFAYTATNAAGTSAPATVSLTIAPPSIALAPSAPSEVLLTGTGASLAPVALTGGVAPYAYSINPALPAGLSLDPATGALSGTPVASAPDTTYTVTVTDSAGQRASAKFVLRVAAPVPALSITPAALPTAREGTLLDLTFATAGGAAPYTYSITAGALPDGLALDPSGRLHGRAIDDATFTMTVTDANGVQGVRAYALTLERRPDPTADAGVRGELAAQVAVAERFARGQADNVQAHLRALGEGFDPCAGGHAALAASSAADVRRSPVVAQAAGAEPPGAPDARTPAGDGRCLGRALAGAGTVGFWSGGTLEVGSSGRAAERGGFRTRGLTAGVDVRAARGLVAGVALGAARDVTRDGERFEVDARAWSLSAYARLNAGGGLAVDAVVGALRLSTDGRRHVAEDDVDVYGQRDGRTWFASLAAVRTWRAAGTTIQPSVRLDVARTTLDAYDESGTTNLALGFASARSTAREIAADVQVRHPFALAAGTLTPLATVGYRRSSDGAAAQWLHYADWPDGRRYLLDSRPLARDTMRGTVGLEWAVRRGWRAELGYDYTGGGAVSRAFRLGVSAGL